MADSLYPVTVGVQHEGCKVIGMVLRTQAGLTIALATASECGRVKCLNGSTFGSTEAYVHATGRHQITGFDRDRELNSKGTGHRAVVGTALLKINDANNPKWSQYRVVESAASL